MPLFSPRRLPTTSYGYQPPPGAIAHGWACSNFDCHTAEREKIRRWPFNCTVCGAPADPHFFDEPSAHEALGAELRYTLIHYPDRHGGLTQADWIVWQYKDRVLHGDRMGADTVRAGMRILDARFSNPGFQYFKLVWEELAADDIDGAADDLVHWLGRSTSDRIATDKSRRANCLQVIELAVRFFQKPNARMCPLADQVRAGCLALAAGAYSELNTDLQVGVDRLARMSGT